MSSRRRKDSKYPERGRNRAGRYSTVNDDTARGARPMRKHTKKKNPMGIILTILFIIVITGSGIFLFFNWENMFGEKVTMEQSTPTPLPTSIATATPTMPPTPTIAPTLSPTPIASQTPPPEVVDVTISAIGDIMCHQAQIDDAYDSATNTYDFTRSFAEIAPSLQKSDLVIGSSLTTYTGEEAGYTGNPLFNTPEQMLTALKNAGVDVLTTGNSHIFDYGWIGLERTNKKIKEAGMVTTGTYLTEQEYYEPLILDVQGLKVAILSYTDTTNDNSSKISKEKLDYCIKYIKKSRIRDNIKEARKKGADIVILSLHWGEEYNRQDSKEMRDIAEYVLDQGADIILGTKPHVIQRVRKKSNKAEDGKTREIVAAYSLGNFISNQRAPYKDAGMILNVHYQKNNTTGEVVMTGADYVPTWVCINETDNDAEKNFRVLPVGKYLNTPELLNTLPPSAKARLQEVWNETTTMVGTTALVPLNE